MKNRKQLETVLYSGLGVLVMLVIAVALNAIFAGARLRADLTEDQAFTLSEGTKRILGRLDTPVQVRFYFSASAPDMDPALKTYAQRVQDLLNEFRALSNGKLEIKKFDPSPDSDAEDSANVDGIQGQQIQPPFGDPIYFGLAVSSLDNRAVIPFISPQRERLLEYDLARAIAQVSRPSKPVLGVMSGLPIFGGMDPMAMMRGGGQRSEPWIFVSELKADYEVREIPVTAEKVDDDVNLLVVVYPKGVTEATQFAMDQFVLRGGKLIAFLDPLSIMDARSAMGGNPLQAAAGSGATLDRLVKAWGYDFDLNKVVSDKQFQTELFDPRTQQPRANPSFLSLSGRGFDTNDVVTSQLGRVTLPFTGWFDGSAAEGLKATTLFRSSPDSQLTDKMMAQFGATEEFKASGKEHPLAVRLAGRFKTAFPDGRPVAPGDTNAPAGEVLKEGKADSVVVLVGDSDLLHEQNFARIQELFGQRIMLPFAANLTFLQNVIEQLTGDPDLIGIRSRATQMRPFTKVREMQAEAEIRYESKIRELEKSLQDTQQKLNEIQRAKADVSQQAILSDEQQQEILRFQQERAKVNQELKAVRKQLRQDVDRLENTLKWANIVGMAFLVTAAGLVIAFVKRQRTAAR
ncbi:MAG: Gldg family protein [Limisphaerales bacterium]